MLKVVRAIGSKAEINDETFEASRYSLTRPDLPSREGPSHWMMYKSRV